MPTQIDHQVQVRPGDESGFVVTVVRGTTSKAHRFPTMSGATVAAEKNRSVLGHSQWAPPTLDVFAKEWLRDYVTRECSASTYKDYENCLNKLVLRRLGGLRLDAITRGEVGVFIADLQTTEGVGGMILGRRTLSAMLGIAQKWGYIRENPVSRFSGE
jgi:hypothetical protein